MFLDGKEMGIKIDGTPRQLNGSKVKIEGDVWIGGGIDARGCVEIRSFWEGNA